MDSQLLFLSSTTSLVVCFGALLLITFGHYKAGTARLPVDRALGVAGRLVGLVDVLVSALTSVSVAAASVYSADGSGGRGGGSQDSYNECLTVTENHVQVAFAIGLMLLLVALLRISVFITTLHTVDNAAVLVDIARGVGILCLSLIYTVPIIIVCFIKYPMTSGDSVAQLCLPVSTESLPDAPFDCLIAAWIGALLVHVASVGWSVTSWQNLKAVFVASTTHFLPMYMLRAWIRDWLQEEVPIVGPELLSVIMVTVITFGALCTWWTFSLVWSTIKNCSDVKVYDENMTIAENRLSQHDLLNVKSG